MIEVGTRRKAAARDGRQPHTRTPLGSLLAAQNLPQRVLYHAREASPSSGRELLGRGQSTIVEPDRGAHDIMPYSWSIIVSIEKTDWHDYELYLAVDNIDHMTAVRGRSCGLRVRGSRRARTGSDKPSLSTRPFMRL